MRCPNHCNLNRYHHYYYRPHHSFFSSYFSCCNYWSVASVVYFGAYLSTRDRSTPWPVRSLVPVLTGGHCGSVRERRRMDDSGRVRDLSDGTVDKRVVIYKTPSPRILCQVNLYTSLSDVLLPAPRGAVHVGTVNVCNFRKSYDLSTRDQWCPGGPPV